MLNINPDLVHQKVHARKKTFSKCKGQWCKTVTISEDDIWSCRHWYWQSTESSGRRSEAPQSLCKIMPKILSDDQHVALTFSKRLGEFIVLNEVAICDDSRKVTLAPRIVGEHPILAPQNFMANVARFLSRLHQSATGSNIFHRVHCCTQTAKIKSWQFGIVCSICTCTTQWSNILIKSRVVSLLTFSHYLLNTPRSCVDNNVHAFLPRNVVISGQVFGTSEGLWNLFCF